MSIPKNKYELLEQINDSFMKLHKDYLSIKEKDLYVKEVEGNIKNTKISSKDTLSYLIGWLELVNIWLENKDNIEYISFPHKDYKWNELGLLAKSFYIKFEDTSFSTLIRKHHELTNIIVEKVTKISNDELYGRTWYKTYTLGRMIQFNTSSPNKNIRTKIRKFIKSRV